jgi:hypothetical protein
MTKIRKESIIIGVLIIMTFVFGILSIESYIDKDSYISEVARNAISVKISLMAQLVLACLYITISFMIYGVIKMLNPLLSNGFLIFKIVSQVFNIAGTVFIVALIALSSEFASINTDAITFSTIGQILKAGRDFVNHVLMILLNSIAITLFSYFVYRFQIAYRWIAILGFLGSVLSIIASFLVLFGTINVISNTYLIMNVPLALQDISLALFLIIKGFNERHIPDSHGSKGIHLTSR